MICPNCQQKSNRIIIRRDGSYCENCSGITATGGAKISGILTRQSYRVRNQQERGRADFIPPHVHDPVSGKDVPNPDFVKHYPQHTSKYYSEEEVRRSGNKKLKQLWDKQDAKRVSHQQKISKLSHGSRDIKGDKKRKVRKLREL